MSYFSKVTALLTMVFCGLLLSGGARAEDASVYIISPVDGEVVHSPVLVRFGLRGMGVAPAGVDVANTGHHHLLIDVDELPALDQPVPADDKHLHFGKGQTEVKIQLEPGEHTLQLMLGDKFHMPVGSGLVSEKINIRVK